MIKKEKIINLIEEKIKEHEEQGNCTIYDIAQADLNNAVSNAFDYAYDCGRYEVLNELLNDIKEMK